MAEKVTKDTKPAKESGKDASDSRKPVHIASGKSAPGWKPSPPVPVEE